MEMCIIKSVPLGLALEKSRTTYRSYSAKPAIKIDANFGAGLPGQRYISSLANALFPISTSADASLLGTGNMNWTPQVYLNVKLDSQNEFCEVYVGLSSSEEESGLFRCLVTIFGGLDKFSVAIDIELGWGECNKISLHDITIRPYRYNVYAGGSVKFTNAVYKKYWYQQNQHVPGNITVNLRLTAKALDMLRLNYSKDSLSLTKKLMLDYDSSDAVLVAGDGKEVQCHKLFLSAQSPVFKAMFKSTMKEGVSGTVKIEEMTEKGVRALIKYVYTWELEEAFGSCTTALQLLLAADKYDMEKLEKEVRELLVLKENEWFTVSVALKLLEFEKKKSNLTGIVDDGAKEDVQRDESQSLEAKCLAVLKSKSSEDFNECSVYQQMFRNDLEAAIELCTSLITLK